MTHITRKIAQALANMTIDRHIFERKEKEKEDAFRKERHENSKFNTIPPLSERLAMEDLKGTIAKSHILLKRANKILADKDFIAKTIPFNARVDIATAEIEEKTKEILLKYGIVDTEHGYADAFATDL